MGGVFVCEVATNLRGILSTRSVFIGIVVVFSFGIRMCGGRRSSIRDEDNP